MSQDETTCYDPHAVLFPLAVRWGTEQVIPNDCIGPGELVCNRLDLSMYISVYVEAHY